jgi:hypothetical protein
MGTRGIIAKPEGDGWAGRYHHWDSYPSGLGATLIELHADHFAGDVDAMIAYLIDGEPVGWSTINGADWSLPKGWHNRYDDNGECAVCGQEYWRHYHQNYPHSDDPADEMVNGHRRKGLLIPDTVLQLGHSFEEIEQPHGPQSYSARGEDGDYWHHSTDEEASGAEWCYVLCKTGIIVFEGDYGAFGQGGGNWKCPTFVRWGDRDGMLAVEERAAA